MELSILPNFSESATYTRTQVWLGSMASIFLLTLGVGLGLAVIPNEIGLILLTAALIYLAVWHVALNMGRARDLGLNGAWGLIMLLPYVSIVGFIIGGFFPTNYFRKDT